MAVIEGGNVIAGARQRTWLNAGAPTNGTSGTHAGAANPGDLLVDTTNFNLYINTNTLASPTWTEVPSQAAALAALASSLNGSSVATVADANVIGAIPVIFRKDVAAGATADIDVVVTNKVRVINAWLVKGANAGGGAGTIQIKNGASAITDAMSINIAANTIQRAATIDQTQWEIAAAGTLRFTRTRSASTDEACTVFVEALRVA